MTEETPLTIKEPQLVRSGLLRIDWGAAQERGYKSREDYVILAGRKHGPYEYGDLWVAKRRLADFVNVQKAANSLGLSVKNTALKSDGYPYDYIGGITWEEALKLNLAMGAKTLNAMQVKDFLSDLMSSAEGNKYLYDANGKLVGSNESGAIYNDFTGFTMSLSGQSHPRHEWIDKSNNDFNGKSGIFYDHQLNAAGKLEPQGRYIFSDHQENDLEEFLKIWGNDVAYSCGRNQEYSNPFTGIREAYEVGKFQIKGKK